MTRKLSKVEVEHHAKLLEHADRLAADAFSSGMNELVRLLVWGHDTTDEDEFKKQMPARCRKALGRIFEANLRFMRADVAQIEIKMSVSGRRPSKMGLENLKRVEMEAAILRLIERSKKD